MSRKTTPWQERFWKYVNKNGPVMRPELGRCWVWTGSCTRGYGYLLTERGRRGRAHRLSYELHAGCQVSDGCVIKHECDNPACVNPDHLRADTQNGNMQDMITRGRDRHLSLKGEAVVGSKLTAGQVREMRRQRANGKLLRELAADFGVSVPTVHRAVLGLNWAHV